VSVTVPSILHATRVTCQRHWQQKTLKHKPSQLRQPTLGLNCLRNAESDYLLACHHNDEKTSLIRHICRMYAWTEFPEIKLKSYHRFSAIVNFRRYAWRVRGFWHVICLPVAGCRPTGVVTLKYACVQPLGSSRKKYTENCRDPNGSDTFRSSNRHVTECNDRPTYLEWNTYEKPHSRLRQV